MTDGDNLNAGERRDGLRDCVQPWTFGEKVMKGWSGEVRRGVFDTTRPPIKRPLELGSNPDEMSTRVTP